MSSSMLETLSSVGVAAMMSGSIPTPQPPPQPIRLSKILCNYAIALFNCEWSYHPKNALVTAADYGDIAKRTENLVEQNVKEFERKSFRSLQFHGSLNLHMEKVRGALSEHVRSLTVVSVNATSPTEVAMITAGLADSNVSGPAPEKHQLQLPPPQQQEPRLFSAVHEHLQALLDESGIDVQTAAKALGVTPKSIYRHLNGTAHPRRAHLSKYEDLFTRTCGRDVKVTRKRSLTTKKSKNVI